MESAFEEDLHIPLPGITDPHTFENWIKCVMGMNITRKALRKSIELGAKQYLLQMPKEEIYHFETFSDCLKKENVFHLSGSPKDEKKKKINWTCNHELCWKILHKLLDFHAKHEKLKRKWVIPVIPPPIASAMKDPSEEGKNAFVICDEYFWDIMKLYTYNEILTGDGNSDEIDKIELVLLLQILSNCTFPQFSEFEELHEQETTKARNAVMHSGDSSYNDSELCRFFRRMIDTLEIFSDQFKCCKKAAASLVELKGRELFKLAKKQDELTLVIGKALKTRNEALEFDIETCINQQELMKLRTLFQASRHQFERFDTAEKVASNKSKEESEKLEELEGELQEKSWKLQDLRGKVESLEKALRNEQRRNMGRWQRLGRAVDNGFWFW